MAWGSDADLGSGLPDRFQFTVRTAKIGKPYEKNPMQSALILEGEQNVDGEIEDQHIWLKAGETFEPGDVEGTFWLHTQQTPDVFEPGSATRPKKLNKNSGYGKFLNSVKVATGGFDVLGENQSPDRAKYEIWDVKFWEGLVLDIEVKDEPYSFTNKQGENIEGSKRQEYVVGVLGKADGSSTPAQGPNADATGQAASTNGSVDFTSYDSYIAFLEAHVEAGGSSSDEKAAAAKAHFEAAKA